MKVTRFYMLLVPCLLLTSCTGGSHHGKTNAGSARHSALPGAFVTEPTPYRPTGVIWPNPTEARVEPFQRSMGAVDASLPWRLVSPSVKGGPELLITYNPGCNQRAAVQLTENQNEVVVQVIRHSPASLLMCLTTATDLVPLTAPLGNRRLLHAPTSSGEG